MSMPTGNTNSSSISSTDNYDNREPDDGTGKQIMMGSGASAPCGGNSGGDCGEDIKRNFDVYTDKIVENLGRLQDRWEEIKDNYDDIREKSKPSLRETLLKEAIMKKYALLVAKNKFMSNKDMKLKKISSDVNSLESEAELMLSELEITLVEKR